MFFKFDPPSISSIRAKFLIEKLSDLPSGFSSISLCATGRTGSGKTTLGNRLIGSDYFMPSTGEQDCTDEVNLVEFPSGLKYFDLPGVAGVASKGKLENYNRVALGIEQRRKFQNVNDLTLSQYGVGCEPRKNIFTVSEFRQRQILEPDLILYIIAPDKQFLDVDCLYLGDLLSRYSQVIYVFNMFADKQTGSIYATEQNIRDVATRIKEVHTFVLGEESQPIIVPVSCWTGEGISELISCACKVLGREKGRLFEELIYNQQQKTPDEYLYQLKKKVIDTIVYVTCQKPEGSYTCDQPIHKACHELLEFLIALRIQSKQSSDFSDDWINKEIHEALSIEVDKTADRSIQEDIFFLQDGYAAIEHGIELLNQLINTHLAEASDKAVETRAREILAFESEIHICQEQIAGIEEELNSQVEEYKLIEDDISSIATVIDNYREKRNNLVDRFNYLNKQIGLLIDSHNASANVLSSFISDLDSRIDRYNFRKEKFNVRINAINSTVNRLKSSPYKVSESAINSLQSEINSVNREEISLESERNSVEELIGQRNRRISNLEDDANSIRRMIVQRDEIEVNIDREDNKIETKREQGIAKLKLQESLKTFIQENLRLLSEKSKYRQNTIEFGTIVLDAFNEVLEAIMTKINSRIEDINSRLATIRDVFINTLGMEAASHEQISYQRERVNECLEEMQSFSNEIAHFQMALQICASKITINKLIGNVIRECTIHHFDSTGEFEYRGSTYHYFGKQGLSLILSLIHLVVLDNEIGFDSSYLLENTSGLFDALEAFPSEPDTRKVVNWLESRIEQLFTTSFNEMVIQAVL